MLIILEGHFVDMRNHIYPGTEEDRVILYNEETVEEILKGKYFSRGDSVDLLSGKRVSFDLFQLEQFVKVGIPL